MQYKELFLRFNQINLNIYYNKKKCKEQLFQLNYYLFIFIYYLIFI